MAEFFYVYGVVNQTIDSTVTGFEGKPLELIQLKDLLAVVSRVSDENFSQEQIDKNVKDLTWLAENAPLHENVVDAVLQKTDILPFKFCTIFKTEADIKKMLEANYNNLQQNMEFLKGKAEVSVKLFYDPEKLTKQLEQELEQVKDLKKELETETEGKAYFTQQKINTLLRQAVQQKLAEIADSDYIAIAKHAQMGKSKQLLKLNKEHNPMFLNAVFLLEKNTVTLFSQEAEKLKDAEKGITVSVSKAFPPYNFVK